MTIQVLPGVARLLESYRRNRVKRFWSQKWNPCANAEVVFNAIAPEYRDDMKRVLEFGSSWGGNLKYFMDQLPSLSTVGIDVNPIVRDLANDYPNYTGILGDESTLAKFGTQEFDLAFTVSVLDHLPFRHAVDSVVGELARISRRTVLLEPFIDGVEGDVSSKTRNQVKPGLERGHKKFAPYSYLWNYDEILTRRGLRWEKQHTPLHSASLGPFYYLYVIY